MEQQSFSLVAFRLSQRIEQGFSRFSPQLPFDRDLIVCNPAEAIELGLVHLQAISAISQMECTEHLSNFNWGKMRLEKALQDARKRELLEALVRNLKFWYDRYSEKQQVLWKEKPN